MPYRVLVVPDKFKGTLSAAAAADAIASGWRVARPNDQLAILPMCDGGDGFGPVMSSLLGAVPQRVRTVDAAHRPVIAPWWWEPKTRTAVIESARVIGLAMLPAGQFHPFQLDTFGLGTVIRSAIARGAKQILIGIGGSATNDGGFGMARALGWEFRGKSGRPVRQWTDLPALMAVSPSTIVKPGVRAIVAVDVQNPLLGTRGATRIFGPQKGLRPADLPRAERCLRKLASVTRAALEQDFALWPGAGAAGGLGFGLFAFLGALPESGFELFAQYSRLPQLLRASDLVLTGEGAIDRSTLMGKGTGRIAALCRAGKIPCLGLAGVVTRQPALSNLFNKVYALTDLTTPESAKSKPAFWLRRLAGDAARLWQPKA